MPRELIAVGVRQPAFRAYEDAPLQPDQIRVHTEYGAPKHGTELHIYRGDSAFADSRWDPDLRAFVPDQGSPGRFPFPLGNAAVGTVTEVGSEVKGVAPGDRVAGYGPLRETQTWVWGNRGVYPGARAVPKGMTWQNALCLDPATVALGGIRDGGVRIGDRVAVFGLGAIGLLAVQIARHTGATVIAVDPLPARREVALATGAEQALDPTADDVGLAIRHGTRGMGVDVAIETSGSARALHQAVRGLAFGGTVAVVGWHTEVKGGLDLGREAHFNRPRFVFPRVESEPHYDHPRWDGRRLADTAWALLRNGVLRCEQIIQPVVPFNAVDVAYRAYVDEHPESSVKLGVRFNDRSNRRTSVTEGVS